MSGPKIPRRDALRTLAAGAAGLALSAGTGLPLPVGAASRPNVVVIHTDDQDFDSLGCYGHRVHTPHIDALASGGVRFDRAYVACSVCTASRFALLTGQYPSRARNDGFVDRYPSGVMTEPSFNTRMTSGQMNIGQALQRAGYATGVVGKWDQGRAVGPETEALPGPARYWRNAWSDVDEQADPRDPEVSALMARNHDAVCEGIRGQGFDYASSIYWGNPESFANHPLNIHNQEWITQGALDFIDQAHEDPFFLYFNTTLHHIPHPQESLLRGDPRMTAAGYLDEAPASQPSRESVLERVAAAGCRRETAYCTWLDDAVGALTQRLRLHGVADQTMIVFVSDNASKDKGTLYEGGVHVPCIVSWPQRLTGDRHTDAVVSNIDLAPTILQACGVALPAGWHLDGHSWMPLLQGQTDTVNEAVFLEIGWTRAVVTQRWKYLALRYPPDVQELIAATREKVYHMRPLAPLQHHALLRHPNFYDPDQLYDLRDDRAETANLAYDQERAADLAGLRERMSTWLRTFEEHPFGEFTA